MLGVLFAIFSSASFALNSASIRRGVVAGSPIQAVYVTAFLGVLLFLVAALVSGQLFDAAGISTKGYWLLAAVGLSHFLAARYCAYRSIAAIGVNRATPIQENSAIITILGGVLLLKEEISALDALGISLTLIAPLIMLRRHRPTIRTNSGAAKGVDQLRSVGAMAAQPEAVAGTTALGMPPSTATVAAPVALRLAEGYFFSVLTALIWGITPLLIRAALKGTGLGIMGGLFSYTIAAAVLALSLTLPGRWQSLQTMSRTTARWFLVGGVTVFLAQMFSFLALSLAPAVIVTTVMRSSIVFRVLFSFLFNRQLESFELSVIAAIVLTGVGTLLLIL